MSAVTFDFGQTLVELDHELLVRRVAERGVVLDLDRARSDTPGAWAAYARAKQQGLLQEPAWCAFMSTLLQSTGAAADDLTRWLWSEQPRHNLWRRPVAGMFELARELHARGVSLGIVTNSEGKAEELAAELGLMTCFSVVADSGVLGFEKPDPRMFQWTAEKLGVSPREIVHVGDSWEADVEGALAAGARAVWFTHSTTRSLPRGVAACATAREVAETLAAWTRG